MSTTANANSARGRTGRLFNVILGAAVVTGLLLAGGTPVSAQTSTARVNGTVVDENGQPVGGLVLRFVPDETSGNPERKLKVNKKGKFSFSFFPYGKYKIELEGSDLFLKSIAYVVKDASGLETDSNASDAHPETGLPALRLPPGQRVQIDLVVTSQEYQKELKQQIAVVEAKGALKKIAELYEQRDMEGVLAEADRLLADKPDLGQALYMRGVALWQLGRPGEAVEALRQALEVIPEQPGILGAIGQALMDQADEVTKSGDEAAAKPLYSEAAEFFQRDFESNPEATASVVNRAAALDRAGETEALEEALMKVLEVQPDNISIYFRLASVYTERGEADKALEILERLPVSDKSAAPAVFNVAVRLYNEENLEGAGFAARKALEIDPDLAAAHHLMSRVYIDKGDNDAAIAEIEKFLELAPDDPKVPAEEQLLRALKQGAP
jgi:tetratricopeptide (TPR) repeat protein